MYITNMNVEINILIGLLEYHVVDSRFSGDKGTDMMQPHFLHAGPS